LSRFIPRREWEIIIGGARWVDKKWEDGDGVLWGVELWKDVIDHACDGLFLRRFGKQVIRIEVKDLGSVGRKLSCQDYNAGNWSGDEWSVGDSDQNDVVWSNYWDKMLKLDNFRDEFQEALERRREK